MGGRHHVNIAETLFRSISIITFTHGFGLTLFTFTRTNNVGLLVLNFESEKLIDQYCQLVGAGWHLFLFFFFPERNRVISHVHCILYGLFNIQQTLGDWKR